MNTTYNRARRLVSLLTQYDQKQSAKRAHNRNALPLYIQAAQAWESDSRAEISPLKTLAEYFTTAPGNPEDFCLTPVRQFVRELNAGKI